MGGGIEMGLDSVELVMAIEEEFGLDIPDRDAEKMITVGERLVRVFVRQLNVRPEEVIMGASITGDLGVD